MRLRHAQHRGLAAPRRSDERGDLVGRDVEVDLAHRGVAAVLHLEITQLEHQLPLALGLLVGHRRIVGSVDVRCVGCVDVGRHAPDVSGGVDERGHGSVLGGHAVCRRAKKAVTRRARMVMMNTMTMSVSAAPQARSCWAENGDVALRKICTDSAVFGPLEEAPVGLGDDPDGEEQRRGLPRGAGHCEQRAADDAGAAFGSTTVRMVRARRLPEGVAAFPQLAGHEREHLVGGADHDREHEAREGERTGEAGLLLGVEHDQRVDEQAHDDRRHAGHDLGEEADEPCERLLAAVFVEVDPAEDARAESP